MTRLRGDLHIHSTVSDGKHSPEEIVVRAVEKGLEVISITDHDSFEGSLRARRAVESMGLELVVVIGNEVRTTHGDILVYCADHVPERVPKDPLQLRDYMQEEGCLVVPAHPFDKRRMGIGELVYEGGWSALEVFNAYSDPWSNEKAKHAAKELGLPGLANSDAHIADSIGVAYNIIEVSEVTPEGVIESIGRGRIAPRPGRPGVREFASSLAWSIERRLRRRRGGESRLDYLADYEARTWGEYGEYE